MGYTPEEAALLRRYVSNLDRNIYTIFNLPEEVVAVVFAKVSRSPHSFRDNLLALIQDRELALAEGDAPATGAGFDLEKARRFHERVVIGYGHSSVAELAVAHVGIERVSRLASARLELSNPFLSFIEYSQRYQRPARGAYYTPPELEAYPDLLQRYRRLMDLTFDAYEELLRGLVAYLRRELPRGEQESEKAWSVRVEKTAFEDARYALTLAVHTNLGMTGNGRAIRDSLARLLSDPYPEVRAMAAAIREEVSAVLPVLLRHAVPNPYRLETRAGVAALLREMAQPAPAGEGAAAADPAASGLPLDRTGPVAERIRPPEARLVEWTGQEARWAAAGHPGGAGESAGPASPAQEAGAGTGAIPPDEVPALIRVAEGLAIEYGAPGLEAGVRQLPPEQLVRLFREAVARLGPHDHPLEALHRVHYGAAFTVSEACWHQLLRHCRKVEFAPAEPSIAYGWVVPPNVAAAGLTPVLERAVAAAEELYLRLADRLPLVAPYVVTNAHRRRALARFDLWELYHLVNLRGSSEAQWEIRQAILDLNRQVAAVHPHLAPWPRRP